MPQRRPKLMSRTLYALSLLLFACSPAAAQGVPAAPPGASAPEPVSVAIVMDVSASVSAQNDSGRKWLRQAVARFVEAGGGLDEFFVIKVSTKAELYLDGTVEVSRVSKALSKLMSRRELGATALYDGCALAVAKVAGGKHARRVVLLLSDGVDTVSELPIGEVEKLLKRTGVSLYFVEVGERPSGGNYYEQAFGTLSGLASASGGAAYRFGKASEFDSILAGIRSGPGR